MSRGKPFRFALRGPRVLTRTNVEAVLEQAPALAWGAPGKPALVVVTADQFAQLTGFQLHEDTFRPSRWCARCGAFTGGRRCLACSPPCVACSRRGAQ